MKPSARVLLFVAAASAPCMAQESLHAAWLRETLDLDVKAAVRSYESIAADARANMLDRQIAVARLEELRRIQAPAAPKANPTELLPENLRPALDPDSSKSIQQSITDLTQKQPTEQGAREFQLPSTLPVMRPLVHEVVESARSQSRQEETRGRMGIPRPSQGDSSRVLERIRALEIARAELAGDIKQADELRQRSFPSWKAPAWPEDRSAAWAMARENLVRWQQERQMSGAERDILTRLLQALDEDAKQSPGLALTRIDRLPVYCERLHTTTIAPR